MTQQNAGPTIKPLQNFQTGQPSYRPPTFSQTRQPQQQLLTEEKVKELIVETLIEFNLVSQTSKKKALSDV